MDVSRRDFLRVAAALVKKTRDETFIERLPNGKLVNMTPAIFSLGGATLDVEWNHIQQKLMRGLDNGYRRPADPGRALAARIVAAP